MWPIYTDFLQTNDSFHLWQPLKFCLLSRLLNFFLLITWVNVNYISMLFMALWEDTKTVKRMEVSTWGLQLIQFDFDLRQSFLLRKDMDLIYSVYYSHLYFLHPLFLRDDPLDVVGNTLILAIQNIHEIHTHLYNCSHMLCNVKRMSNAMCKGCRERTEYSLVFLHMVNNGILRPHNTDWVLSLISYTATF